MRTLPVLPPAGSPNFLLALDTNTTLAFFRMHVDFATPANSTFTGPSLITVSNFTPLCNGGTCVVQPATTVRLDSLADRLPAPFVRSHRSSILNLTFVAELRTRRDGSHVAVLSAGAEIEVSRRRLATVRAALRRVETLTAASH